MNNLLAKYNDYMRLNGCKEQYILVNGIKIEFFYKEENFIHLLGLHKLKLKFPFFWPSSLINWA